MPDFLAMSDDDFLNQMPPDAAPEGEPAAVEENIQATETPDAEVQAEVVAEPGSEEEVAAPVEGAEAEAPEVAPAAPEGAAPEAAAPETAPVAPEGTVAAPAAEPAKPAAPAAAEPAQDYEAFFKQVTAPFTANGKKIELRTPAEAIQLMQMGANYTAKMQALAPHRKLLLMLENNGLLDEGKLSFLIDVEKKNPDAIRKLVKDAGIDPLDIDTSAPVTYREGNHRVTDEEASFRAVLDDLGSSTAGKETLRVVNSEWDQASKDQLWNTPQVLSIINTQRETGIYDRIATEIARQRTLGMITPGTSFLQAYQAVGDKMVAANAFADLVPKTLEAPKPAPALAPPVVLATRVAAPKPVVTNSAQAAAASPTRTTPKTAKTSINPLSMSDEEFMKLSALQV